MNRRRPVKFRTTVMVTLVLLGVAAVAGCQLRQFRQPFHEPALQPLNVR